MIKISNLSKAYGDKTVYENFCLDINDGEITCILGESGSGKTTLLNCLSGTTKCTGDFPKLKCSYVFQTPRLVPNLTVGGNLELICKDQERIRDMLERVHLSDKTKSYPSTLSGGEAQRASLARAFLYGGDIILLDEPFSSLDIRLKAEISGLFFSVWNAEKPAVLFVTHDIDEAISLSHRVIVLKNGKIVMDEKLSGEPPRPYGSAEEERKKLIEVLISC